MTTHSHQALALGMALCSAACQGIPIRDLTEAEEIVFDDRLSQIEASLPFVESLGKSADEKFAFGGNKKGADHFVADVQATFDLVLQKKSEGNVFALDPDDGWKFAGTDGSKLGGIFHPAIFQPSYIAIRADGGWPMEVIMHEGAHPFGAHDGKVRAFVRGPEYTQENNKAAFDTYAEERDFSYLMSAYFTFADDEMSKIEIAISRMDGALETLRSDALDEQKTYMQESALAEPLAQDKEGWINARVAQEFKSGGTNLYSDIGITGEEYGNALGESGIYEYGREIWDEKLKELRAEITEGKRREIESEFRPSGPSRR